MNKDDIQSQDPQCEYNVLGGVHYLSDSHLIPHLLIKNLITFLENKNVELISDEIINIMEADGKKIKSVSSVKNNYEADFYLFSSGVWTAQILKNINLNIPLMPGKGYSFDTTFNNNFPTIPSILVDDRVAVTPMDKFLRIGGAMELDLINSKINMKRVAGIFNSFKRYYPKTNIVFPDEKKVWHGLRPCSPDGLPYIGRSNQYENLFLATGHAMLGLSLGPATGKLISEIISEKPTSIDVSAFSVDRYN